MAVGPNQNAGVIRAFRRAASPVSAADVYQKALPAHGRCATERRRGIRPRWARPSEPRCPGRSERCFPRASPTAPAAHRSTGPWLPTSGRREPLRQTSYPSAAKRIAVARPMPEDAPVMMALGRFCMGCDILLRKSPSLQYSGERGGMRFPSRSRLLPAGATRKPRAAVGPGQRKSAHAPS
jgi:hypothetical protein